MTIVKELRSASRLERLMVIRKLCCRWGCEYARVLSLRDDGIWDQSLLMTMHLGVYKISDGPQSSTSLRRTQQSATAASDELHVAMI